MKKLALSLYPAVSHCAFVFAISLTAFGQNLYVQPRILQPVDETKLTVLKGNTHVLARPEFDRGAAPADLPMQRMLLVLKRSPEQQTALRELLDVQHNKASSSYHKWLTPEQFGKQFGPGDQDMQTVTSWLQAHGFQIGNVAKGRNIIEFSGTAAQVQEALHTSIHKYVVNGEEHWANASDPQIPAALAPVVAGVHTLHNFLKKPQIHISEQTIAAKYTPGNPPKVTFSSTPPSHALGPADFATIYNIGPLYQAGTNGSGVTIAVVGRSDLNLAGGDNGSFANVFATNQLFPATIINGVDPGDLGGGEEAEATLDTTWAGAIAPGAAIDLVVSATTDTTDGVDLSEAYIIDTNLADIMTESFGSCEAAYTQSQAAGYATLAEQAAAQGITYMVSSGDAGAEGCDDPNSETVATGPVSVNILAATGFNIAVGGTMFEENGQDSKYWSTTNDSVTLGSALSYIPENVWNESCTASTCTGDNLPGIWAGSGGASVFVSKPSWQSGVTGIPSDGWRDLPDVSLNAAVHDPYLLCLDNSCQPDSQGNIFFFGVGGTSASAPSFAGIMALVNQKMGARQGQANYVLYPLAKKETFSQCNGSSTTTLPASTCTFNDVTQGNNVVPGEVGNQYQSGVGFDLASGLGSVNAANLVNNWNTVTFNATATTLSLNPTTITHGLSVTANIGVTATNGGTPTGDVSVVAQTGSGVSGKTAIGGFTLSSGSVSQPITSLPGGSYNVTAHYAGDATFAPSDSGTVAVTVTPEGSTTSVSAQTLDQNFTFQPFSSGPYGSFVYLRADVTAQSKQGIPTGIVNFLDGVSSLGSYPLNSQGNTATPNFLNSPNGGTPTGLYTLTPGTHSITANYVGDASFIMSTSSAINLNITTASTTNAVTYTGAPQGAALTATVNTGSGGNPPSGTVTFFVNGAAVGSPVAVSGVPALTSQTGSLQGAQAIANYTDSALANGSYTFSASYSGDTNYTTSTAPTISAKLQPDFGFTENSDTVVITSPGQTGSQFFTVTAWDGFNGTLNFSSSSCSGLPAGATCTFSPSSITGSGSPTLMITTTAQPARSQLDHDRGLQWWLATTGAGFVGMFLSGIPAKRRRSNVLPILLVCIFLIASMGCGGGSSSSTPPPPPPPTPTPIGTSTVVVTATSGSISHTATFTLIVE